MTSDSTAAATGDGAASAAASSGADSARDEVLQTHHLIALQDAACMRCVCCALCFCLSSTWYTRTAVYGVYCINLRAVRS
jgi:hypothetical protein